MKNKIIILVSVIFLMGMLIRATIPGQVIPENDIQLNSSNFVLQAPFAKIYPFINNSINEHLKSVNRGDRNSKVGLKLNIKNDEGLEKSGSFIMSANSSEIVITAKDSIGLYEGMCELEKNIIQNEGEVPSATQTHSPTIKKRFLHLALLEQGNLNKMKKYVDCARRNHYNYIILQVKDHVKLNSMPFAKSTGLSRTEFVELVTYARNNHISVVPEVKFLTHQESYVQDKALLYNSHTYDPKNKAVQKLSNDVIDELVEITKPEFFHIGHDELGGIFASRKGKNDLEGNEQPLPAALFLEDVNRLNNYIVSKKIKTMMWADMLLKGEDFPNMLKFSMHADDNYKLLITEIPKNIILCDWQYFEKKDVTTSKYLQSFGFTTYGSTWWNSINIITFAKSYKKYTPYEDSGMIATTWEGALKNVNQKNNLDITVESIASECSRTYWSVK